MFSDWLSARGRLTRRWAAFCVHRPLFVFVCLCLNGCGTDWLFSKHVYAGPEKAILLSGEKLSCMGCPAFFHFEANGAAIDQIIASHSLICLVLVASYLGAASILGLGYLLGEAVFVGLLAYLEWRAVRLYVAAT